MKRLLLLTILLCCSQAFAALPHGTLLCKAASTTCTATSQPQTGDTLIYFSGRHGSTTLPGLPSGFTSITTATQGASTTAIGVRASCIVAPPGMAKAMPASSNATDVMVVDYGNLSNLFGTRAACNAMVTTGSGIAKGGSTGSTTFTYPALTMNNDGGASTSEVIGLIYLFATSSGALAAPTGMTNVDSAADSLMAVQDTNGPVGSWSAQSVTGGTSVEYEAITLELNAALAGPSACSGTCTSYVDSRPSPSNETGAVAFSSIQFFLLNPSLSGNGIICGFTYSSTSATTPTLTTDQSQSLTVDKFVNDTAQTIGVAHLVNATAGTKSVTLGMPAAENQIGLQCIQVKGLDVADGTPVTATSLGTTVLSTAALTPSQAGDLLYVFVAPSTNNMCCGGTWTWAVPGPGFDLVPPNNQIDLFAEILSTSSTSAITPQMYISPASAYNMVAALYKSAATGTAAPTTGWVPCAATGTISSTAFVQQMPCPFAGVNLMVSSTDASTTQTTVNSMTDTYGDTGANAHTPGAGDPQQWYVQNITGITSSNRNQFWVKVGATASSSEFIQTLAIANADSSAFDGAVEASGAQTNAAGATCVNSANSNSSITGTPNTNRAGVAVFVEFTGLGPDTCGSPTSGAQMLTWQSPGAMNDTDPGYNGGGNAILQYSSNASQTLTIEWANPTLQGASAWNSVMGFYKFAAAAPSSSLCTLTTLGAGPC